MAFLSFYYFFPGLRDQNGNNNQPVLPAVEQRRKKQLKYSVF